MATYYFVDGMRVRTMNVPGYTQGNHMKVFQWARVDATKRAVYTLQNGRWYRATTNAWDRGSKNKPQVITMSEVVDAITKTNWKEIESEIPPVSF